MFSSDQMKAVRIVILEKDRYSVVTALHKLGIINLTKSSLKLPDDSPDDFYSELSVMLSKFDDAIKMLPQRKACPSGQLGVKQLLAESRKELPVLNTINRLVEERTMLVTEVPPTEHSAYVADKARRDSKLDNIEKQLDEISDKHYSSLLSLREMLQILYQREEASYMFKKTESTCIIEGWIPFERKKELIEAVTRASNGRCDISEFRTKELPPTSVARQEILKPFEYIIDLYSVPRSDEINPAWFFLLSFTMFYGLMVSDVGYGIVSLLLAILIAKRTDPEGLAYNMAKIWQYASIASIIFGVFNNSYFGFGLDQYIIPSFMGFDWQHNIATVVAVSVVIGLVQMSIGLWMGFVNNYNRNLKVVAIGKLFLLLLLITGTCAVAGALFGIFSTLITDSCILLAIVSSVSLLSLRPNQGGRIIDMVIYPISYIRIMGFGITSILISEIIDRAFTPNLTSGFGIFILYLVVFCLLHLANLALSTFEGAIQSVRLNFVEFFQEFYTGGGVKFKPFSYKRTYTKE